MNQELTLDNFILERDAQGLAWLSIDCHLSAVNRLSAEVLQELGQVLDYLAKHAPKGLIIQSAKTTGFIAGADIDEFSSLDNAEKGQALVTRGWQLFQRLAAQPYPTLALIRGHCLGGGLELALACRYRLVVDIKETRLALPEVMLGIFPGWGGMSRLPRLIGPIAAMELMLSGRSVDARRAVKLGLADAKVPERLMHKAAIDQVLSQQPARRATGIKALLNQAWIRPLVARQLLKNIRQRDPHEHYQAPRAIVQVWERHGGNALKAPELIEQLTGSDVAQNLLRVFHLQERLKNIGKRSNHAIEHVHIVGAGVMGGDIAALCALHGITVTLQDQNRSSIAAAQGRAATLFERRLKDPIAVRAALDRLVPDPQGLGVPRADIVIEAIIEDAQAKRQLYAQIEPQLKPDALLATNTSSLPLEELSQQLLQPERLLGIHFFNPVARMPLVEVVETLASPLPIKQAAWSFVHQLGKLPLPVQSSPGFLVNAVLAPYMHEAMKCVDEGLSPATIDLAAEQFGMPMGPLELVDTVGLDIAYAAGQQLLPHQATRQCLQQRLDKQQLGRKSGQGFYSWKQGKADKPKAQHVPAGLTERLITPLIHQTQAQVRIGVVGDDDLADAGIIFGTGFAPFRGGPIHYKSHKKAIKLGKTAG